MENELSICRVCEHGLDKLTCLPEIGIMFDVTQKLSAHVNTYLVLCKQVATNDVFVFDKTFSRCTEKVVLVCP